MINEKTLQKIKDKIEPNSINSKPAFTNNNDDGTITQQFHETILVNGILYDYWIDWTGKDDGEDGGKWSEPYDIYKL